MSNAAKNESTVLNWRGPLLAAGIFAVVFAVLLLMAYQNQSNTSDMGSSLRQDPYGTSLLFDSYARAGYQVKRSQDEDSLSTENAATTTAFFVGGFSPASAAMGGGQPWQGEKFRARLEEFLAHGGRVVLIEPAWKLQSKSQGWEVEIEWPKKSVALRPTWIAPATQVTQAHSEDIYLGADAPWLKTDAGWTVLYAGAADGNANAAATPHVYVAMKKAGKGEIIAASQESFLLNEAIKTHPNPVLLDFLSGSRPVIWVDETLHGLHQDQGVLWLVQRYRLQAALLLFWATLLALLWNLSGDLVRRPAADRRAQMIRYGDGAGVAARRLLMRSIPAKQVVAECWEQFRRRAPQDAQAIADDANSGARLRAALAQPPLAGYRQLSRLIAERRAAAKGLVLAEREVQSSSTPSSKTGTEEARIK